MESLKNISNESLIDRLNTIKSSENMALADIVQCLAEIDSRKLYSELGYSSLFSYCTQALGYSESAAYRRIQAARSLADNPQIYESIKSGRLSLCAVAEISRVKENQAKNELLKVSEGKSKREVQLLTAKYEPAVKPKKERIRAKMVLTSKESDLFSQLNEASLKAEEVYSFSFEADKEFMSLFEEVKKLIGHVPAKEVFRRVLRYYQSSKTILKRRVNTKGKKDSRFISKSDKISLYNQSNKQCSYISPDGRRCTEMHGLEVDHIKPYSICKNSNIENLQLLCKTHNILMAEKYFGVPKMRKYTN